MNDAPKLTWLQTIKRNADGDPAKKMTRDAQSVLAKIAAYHARTAA